MFYEIIKQKNRNAFFPPDAKRACELFEAGYKRARSQHEMFLEKGLTVLKINGIL